MKKKIINGLLFAVALVAATSSFVSCKDYEGDDYARLNEELAAAKINAQTTIDELIRLQQAQIQYQINNLFTSYENLYNDKTKASELTKGLQDKLDALMASYKSATTAAAKMTILNEMNKLLMQSTGTDTQGAHSGDAPNATQTIIIMWGDSLRNAYKNAYQALVDAAAAQSTADVALGTANQGVAGAAAAQATANQAIADAAKAQETADAAKTAAAAAQAAADAAQAAADAAQGTANQGVADAAAAQAAADAAQAAADAAQASADAAAAKAEQALADAAAAQATADAANTAAAAVDQALKDYMAAEALVDAATAEAIADIQNQLKDLATKETVEGLTLRVGQIEEAYKAADEKLQNQIDDLNKLVNELAEDIDAIMASLKQEVTGIEIQAAVNPIFGTFAYPVDIQSNILAAYYGTVTTNVVKFPTSDATLAQESSWVWKKSLITKEELEAVFTGEYFTAEKGDILMNEGEGNAGTLYLTVNPSNIDFTDNHNFSLRTSDNQVSKVALSQLKPCTEQLKWGLSHRAIENSANGFYSAEATIAKDQVKDVALSFKVSNIASTLETIMNDWSKVRVADIAKVGYAIVSGLQADAPRLGVQAQWKDEVSGWQNWVSKYDIAAVSINPLGFDFLTKENASGEVENMDFSPAIVKLQSKIDGKIKAFDMELQKMIAIQLGLDVSKLQNLDFKFDQVTKTINVIAAEDKLVMGNKVWDKDEVIAVVDMSTFLAEMQSNTESAIDGLNLFVQSLNNVQGNIDSKLGDIKTMIHNYLTRFMNGIDKVFNKAASFASHPNRFLQPALFATVDGKDVFHISRTHLAPTQIKKGTKLMIFPTTLTGETVAPAFKKYIAVVDAWKFDANYNPTESVTNKFNTGAMNQVLDAKAFNIQKPFEYTVNAPAGTVLEIIYECLGYNGKVAGKKYYIEVYE